MFSRRMQYPRLKYHFFLSYKPMLFGKYTKIFSKNSQIVEFVTFLLKKELIYGKMLM